MHFGESPVVQHLFLQQGATYRNSTLITQKSMPRQTIEMEHIEREQIATKMKIFICNYTSESYTIRTKSKQIGISFIT